MRLIRRFDIKAKVLETYYSKQFKKYYRAQSYQILSVEIDALYNVLILKSSSKCELTRRHEANVKRILKIKS